MKELTEELDDTDIHDDNLTVRSGAGGAAGRCEHQRSGVNGERNEACF